MNAESSQMLTLITVVTTVGTEDQANRLATHLVESRSAACAQIDGPIQSIYSWKDKLFVEAEYRVSCKTIAPLRETIIRSLRSAHPYELPEIIISAVESSAEYADWVASQVLSPP